MVHVQNTISEAIAIIRCKGYREIMLGYQPTYSPRENYYRSAGQNGRQAFNALPDILIPCQTFFSVNDQRFFSL